MKENQKNLPYSYKGMASVLILRLVPQLVPLIQIFSFKLFSIFVYFKWFWTAITRKVWNIRRLQHIIYNQCWMHFKQGWFIFPSWTWVNTIIMRTTYKIYVFPFLHLLYDISEISNSKCHLWSLVILLSPNIFYSLTIMYWLQLITLWFKPQPAEFHSWLINSKS